jgi:hypothetical protein
VTTSQSTLSQYEVQNAAALIDGYFIPRPLEQTESAFERARAECLKHMRRTVECLEEMTVEKYRDARRPSKPSMPDESEGP